MNDQGSRITASSTTTWRPPHYSNPCLGMNGGIFLDNLDAQVDAQAVAYKQAAATFNSQVAGIIAEGLAGAGGWSLSDANIAAAA